MPVLGLDTPNPHHATVTRREPLTPPEASTVDQVAELWDSRTAGVFDLPSGRLVRGRALRKPIPAGPLPRFGLYLQARPFTTAFAWPSRWLRWPDFGLPHDAEDARAAVGEVWERARLERVEVACQGGLGRTGTVLACLAVLDGVPAPDAVRYVRRHYRPGAVETPGQRAYASRFQPLN